MGLRPRHFSLVLFVVTVMACATRSETPALGPESGTSLASGRADIAKRFIDLVATDKADEAFKMFDAEMAKAFPLATLRATWAGLLTQVGPFVRIASVTSKRKDRFEAFSFAMEFEDSYFTWRVALDTKTGMVSGLFLQPGRPPLAPEKEPKRPATVDEREVTVGSGEWALPGTLATPAQNRAAALMPGVVLVHGSGPNDRDESVGPNRPFRDIAWGLAARGIAVLRYDKRTRVHAAKLKAVKQMSLKEEVFDDAVAAANLLRSQPGVNPQQVYLVGHSLGASTGPLIARADPRLAGLVLMAGSTRPFEEVIKAQVTYLLSISRLRAEEKAAALDKINAQFERVRPPGPKPDAIASDLPLGIPPAMWHEYRERNPPKAVQAVKLPILVLQGGRDYQVTVDDFEGWKRALEGRKNAEFILYPTLNHFFLEGKGRPTPKEYNVPSRVPEQVILDIVAFIRRR
ncbi:MAG: alpha/beta fold hydrolase [Deltaproteobacteria bacterium]|nr:alpha/beta fold hydrolase [Deltaproteobacteria bacterium]